MTSIENEVQRLFSEAPKGKGHRDKVENPVTGDGVILSEDDLTPQMWIARRALVARERFRLDGPVDAPPLPIHVFEITEDVDEHPSFEDYARGAMAMEGFLLACQPDLKQRYTPRHLPGLSRQDMAWRPPEEHAKHMASVQRIVLALMDGAAA